MANKDFETEIYEVAILNPCHVQIISAGEIDPVP